MNPYTYQKPILMATVQKIVPNLWFAYEAEDAAKFYVSVFKNGKIKKATYYGREGFEIHKMKSGTVMTVEFEIGGQTFVALNGGPHFKFNEAVSFIINCDTQEEIDYFWNKLGEGGDPKAQQCGWLKDKYGLSWQVVPTILSKFYQDAQENKTERVTAAMLKMKKLDIAKLQEAYDEDSGAESVPRKKQPVETH